MQDEGSMDIEYLGEKVQEKVEDLDGALQDMEDTDDDEKDRDNMIDIQRLILMIISKAQKNEK